ncbi:kinase-like domain-containing protein [Phyllosticta capitalensis]
MRLDSLPSLNQIRNWNLPKLGSKLTGDSGRMYMICDGRTTPWYMGLAKDLDQKNSFTVFQPATWEGMGSEALEINFKRFENGERVSKIFRDSKHIWRIIDTIQPASKYDPPRQICGPFRLPLSDARVERLFTRREVKSIMKDILVALQEIESKGFVYADLSTEDILLSKDQPPEPTEVFAQLWAKEQLSLPFCMHELDGDFKESYRAPEIFFGKPCSFPAHIWSWGIILTHLLESRTSWMRNDWEELWVGTMLDNWRKGWEDSHYDDWGCWRHDFLLLDREMVGDFGIKDCEYFADCELPDRKLLPFETGDWKEHLLNKGLRDDDVCFLDWVLDPNPETRPTSEQIMKSGFLEWNEEDSLPA